MDKNVTLSNPRIEGLRPDGNAQINSDLEFFITFAQSELSNCSATGGCDDAAYIEWYVNGTKVQSSVWNQNSPVIGGWVANYRYVIPVANPGKTLSVSVKSKNTVAFPTVNIADPLPGSIPIGATDDTDADIIKYITETGETQYSNWIDLTGGNNTNLPTYLSNDTTTTTNNNQAQTSGGGIDSIIKQAQTFYTNNQVISIAAVAIIGALFLFGGRRRRRED